MSILKEIRMITMMGKDSKKCVRKKSKRIRDTLVSIIINNIKPNALIFSSMWPAYFTEAIIYTMHKISIIYISP